MATVMLRFKVSDDIAGERFVNDLVTAWTESEGISITAGSTTRDVDLTYVKES